ncbi:MAG: OadG family protein [Spirochaetales bacterium]|nr:OadG family protein [Spirochaetales bacterium]
MALGMGIVFSFLVILILSMRVSSFIINRFFPEKEEEQVLPGPSGGNDAQIALAIAAARRYQK